jgi:hypothetical protein
MVVGSPFDEFEFSHQYRPQPAAFLHLLSGETLAPTAASGFREIHEWAGLNLQTLKALE